MDKPRQVEWAFYEMSGSGRAPIPKGALEVRFFYANCTSGFLTINNTLRMNGFNQYTTGTTIKFPFEVILVNNQNEFDGTEYNVKMTDGDTLIITVKYYKE